jgi:DNA-binding response OmpR family regulator
MPKIDGYGVLKILRENPRTVAIPFIFLSGKGARDDLRVGMDLGADDYLSKPFNKNELLSAVEARLAKHAILPPALRFRVE